MLGEQRLQVLRHLGHLRRRHADVLDDQRRARRAHLADQPVHALAHRPVDLDRLGVAVELGRRGSARGRRAPRRRAPRRASSSASSAPPNSTSSAAENGSSSRQLSRGAADVVRGDDQRRRDHQLDRPGARGDELLHRLDRRVDAREVKPGDRRPRRLRHGLERRLGDERERALAADQQPAEDLERGLGVEEGAEPVAGGVLDRELATDPLGELVVGEDLVADLEQTGGELGLGLGEALARRRRRRSSITVPEASTKVSSRTVSYESWVMPQRMPPELLAITPPTQAMSVEAGSGPSL